MSPRPRLCRKIRSKFHSKYFKPVGKPARLLEEIEMTREEAEALNLVDLLGMDQITAAKRMKTSQSTLQRILAGARRKITEAVIKGKVLKID